MNKKINLGTTIFLCILVGVISFMSAWTITRSEYKLTLNNMKLSYPEAMKLMEIIDYYDKYYIYSGDEALSENLAMSGFVSGTGDKYGKYYSEEEYREIIEDDNGNFVGIGITVITKEGGVIKVERVIKDSPAEKAGILTGDCIIGVDDVKIEDSVEALMDAIKGEEGTEVKITVLRDGEKLTLKAIRAKVTTESVFWGYIEEEKIGFVRIFEFDNTTPTQFKEALDELKGKGAEKFIFDLRDNGGGLLTSITGVLEQLLPKDTLITTSTLKNGSTTEYKTKKEYEEFNYPAAVLVNGYTASAAELFTANMRDYDKAVIVGETTYGKGVMQSTFLLSDGSALKLTTAYYSAPNGENYDGKGIEPSVKASIGDGVISYYEVDIEDEVIKAAINELSK